MADDAGQKSPSKIAWFGTAKGILALIATVLAIVASTFSIMKAIDERRGEPKFSGFVADPRKASDFVDFLTKNDGKDVRLDIACVPFGAGVPDPASCSQGDEELLPTPRDDEILSLLELFTAQPCPNTEYRCPGTHWVTFRLSTTDDEQVNNGRFGAGAIVAKGKFKVLYRGGLGSTPEDVENIELRAVD